MFFKKQSEFRKQAGACLWKKLVQAQSMLALCLFIKILLGVCLRKRLDQARNMTILEKLLHKMCCCCDTAYLYLRSVKKLPDFQTARRVLSDKLLGSC